jgi:asparagine synthase (glutamine-hydrolysing)
MCGVFFVHSKKKVLEKERCNKIKKKLYNRGPDFLKFNYFFNDTVFLLNSVLSITGKNRQNSELIESKNKNLIISFNGEIYNYKTLLQKDLSSFNLSPDTSDTEVLVNLYQKISKNYKLD